MEKLDPTVAQQIAQAAIAFQQQRTGHEPQSVAVVLSGDTVLITLHGALSPAEKALSQSPAGAAQVQEFHRQLFASSVNELRQEIKRITGVDVREATTEIETTTGTVVQVFTTGTMVQVFLLAHGVPAGSWSGNGLGKQSEEKNVVPVTKQPLEEGVTIMGGKTDVVKGRIKEAAGALTGNDKLRDQGKTDQVVGKAKQAVDKAANAAKKAVKKVIG
jgi:uncharacterized protein YbcI/uncharacterized protein YjbJ (UPF0337 family)